MDRCAGVLMPVSSIPGRHGIGTFGEESFKFIDLLNEGGFSLWQILPLTPLGFGNSPYQPYSSFAIDEIYIDLDILTKKGLIDSPDNFLESSLRVRYDDIRTFKSKILFEAFKKEISLNSNCLDRFINENNWVKSYAAYMTFKRSYSNVPWNQWKFQFNDKIFDEIEKYDSFAEIFKFNIWLQMTAYDQWNDLHQYANSKNIKVIGDLPFYVGYDSSDVWANKEYFLLDNEYNPSFVAGVPPDYFSKTGQRWGNPIYDWNYLKEHDYDFLIDRILISSKVYDILRLDHFRAFDTFWRIPTNCETAIDGEWIIAPGEDFFNKLFEKNNNLNLIAEDLGLLRQEVYQLRDKFNFPGMNVVQFTFEDAEIKKTVNWNVQNQVIYLGTHDNDTINGYFYSLSDESKNSIEASLGNLGFSKGTINEKFINYAYSRESKWFILDMQDLLGLNSDSRMNIPGIVDENNWTWRMNTLRPLKEKITFYRELNEKYGR